MSARALCWALCCWTLGGLVAAGGAWAQPLPEDDEEIRRHGIFLDTLDVSLVNVEVYVDQDGEPVTDLTPEDFEVLDDGNPVEISHFFRVSEGRRVEEPQEPGAPEPGTPQPGTPQPGAPQPGAPEPGAQEPSTVIILVDHPFLAPATGKMIFDRIAEQLGPTLALGTQVMVVSKDRRVEIVQPLTTDSEALRRALETLAAKPGSTAHLEVGRLIQSITNGPTEGLARSGPGGQGATSAATSRSDARSAYRDARAYSQEVHNEMRLSLRLLKEFVGSLAGLPGRKALLYVADRLPTRPGELVWQAWVNKYGFDWGPDVGVTSVDSAVSEFDTTQELRALIADANGNRVAFYPMGLGAEGGPNLAGAESRGVTVAGGGFSRTRERDQGLRWLADRTGGRSAVGRGDAKGFFQGLQADLTEYYSLAFASPHRGDGKTHQLEIRVRRPGVHVRYLEEYLDKSGDHQMAERTLSSLILGGQENPLEARVKLGKAKRQKDGLYRLPIEVLVPMANLVLLPGETAHTGKLTLILVVRDAEGGLSEPVRVRLPFEVPNGGLMQALSDSLQYPTELVIREGRQALAVGLRDDLGDVGSTVMLDVEVGS